MTLFKQIALLVSIAFLLLASVILINDFKRAGEYLQGQLQTSAQDMTTLLGIAISQLPDGSDPATLEVLFNSIFDSGYYTRIELMDVNGGSIHQKSRSIQLDNVPDWFLNLVSLSPAEGSTQVMKGWTQLGTLKLSLHPGFAYSSLYATLVSTIKWFAVLLISSILGLWFILHYLLQPLQRVKEQADLIHKNQFVLQDKLPRTVELKRVVEAINRMVSKVQSVFADQEQTLQQYQQLLYHDKLTGLGNRQYMLDHLQQSLSVDSSFHGCLGIIKLVNLEQLREQSGYLVHDDLLKNMAESISLPQAGFNAEKTARLNDDEFAFLLSADEHSTVGFVENLFQQFRDSAQLQNHPANLQLVAAVSSLTSEPNLGSLLSEIDYSLTQATNDGPFSIRRNILTSFELPLGKMQWRSWFQEVIHSDGLFLVGQLAFDQDQKLVQKELFIRARNQQNQIIPAAAFMPMAASLGLALEIDKAVFRLLHESPDIDYSVPLAVNLSMAFFERADGHEEFNQLLSNAQSKKRQLCIEASHHILLQHTELCAQIAERVRKHGHQFGIDNLDLGQSLQLLQTAEVDYVKINANTLKQMSSDEMSSAYRALKTLTDTLDVKIIAVGVDSQASYDELKAIGIQYMQGNHLNEPEIV